MNIASAAGRLLALYKTTASPPGRGQVIFGGTVPEASDPLKYLRVVVSTAEVLVVGVLALAAGVLLAVAIYIRVIRVLLLALYKLLRRPPRPARERVAPEACAEMVPVVSRRR